MANFHLRIWISIVALTLLTCLEQRRGIVGHWKSDPRESQFGMTVDELCFRADGSYVAHSMTQAGTLTSSGRYEVHGNTLRFFDDKGVEVERVSIELSADSLITRETGYKPLIVQYHRQRSACN